MNHLINLTEPDLNSGYKKIFDTGILHDGIGIKCKYDIDNETFVSTIYCKKGDNYCELSSTGNHDSIDSSIEDAKLGMPLMSDRIKTWR